MGTDKRSFERFDFEGKAMLLLNDRESGRTLAITNYRNISQGGACIVSPDVDDIEVGDRLFLMPQRSRRQREAVVVQLGTGSLHLQLVNDQRMTDIEVAELTQRFDDELSRVRQSTRRWSDQ
ncbi:MAG: PilZ domain-containing protein [Dongiaceae bacterium]